MVPRRRRLYIDKHSNKGLGELTEPTLSVGIKAYGITEGWAKSLSDNSLNNYE
jgi:hypothetical protein